MSQLSKLYLMIANAQELGINLGNDVYKQTDKLEEEIIKKEILPVIKEQIEPTLRQIKRDLTLVVDYVPNVSIRVRLSRESGIYNKEEFVDLTADPQATHSTHVISKPSETRAKASKLIVHLPDGKVIQEDTAAATLVEAIKQASPMRVRPLGIICCRVPLVSTTKDKKYGDRQVDIGNGLYVITHSNNKMKKDYIEKISKALHLGWKVEIIK
ncbi:MAG: hypothetical protein J5490_08960 [Bacteroidales bacterium]|nr:hypothetical protein [Bacteroidales bacterium]